MYELTIHCCSVADKKEHYRCLEFGHQKLRFFRRQKVLTKTRSKNQRMQREREKTPGPNFTFQLWKQEEESVTSLYDVDKSEAVSA